MVEDQFGHGVFELRKVRCLEMRLKHSLVVVDFVEVDGVLALFGTITSKRRQPGSFCIEDAALRFTNSRKQSRVPGWSWNSTQITKRGSGMGLYS